VTGDGEEPRTPHKRRKRRKPPWMERTMLALFGVPAQKDRKKPGKAGPHDA
jgi:hypothetical protein